MVADLSPCITETGEYLLEAIQNADEKEKSDELFEMFSNKNKHLLRESGKCLVYANMRAEIFKKENMKFNRVHKAVRIFSYELINILKQYNQKAVKTSADYFDALCDEVQQKLMNSTEKAEYEMFDYCIKLDNDQKIQRG